MNMIFHAKTIPPAATTAPIINALYRQSLMRGWACFNGATGAIDDSYNVTTVNDSGASGMQIVWDTDFANANYVVIGAPQNDPSGSLAGSYFAMIGNSNKAVGSCFMYNIRASDGAVIDPAKHMIMAIGTQ